MARFIGMRKKEGWKSALPFYSFYCDVCKRTVENYPSGFNNVLLCPICLKRMNGA